MPNRLKDELSPYLLQHAGNPVDWYPWCDEAFEKAAAEDRPVFLSIGYATCHWCHVMERESFEDEEVARLMNEAFVSIKVDREERPDIDQVYMTYCQYTTGHGGWPLTIVMTPDRKPFFAATYLPKHGRHGRPGMMDLIPRIQELWRTRREEIVEAAGQNVTLLGASAAWEAAAEAPGGDLLDAAFHQLKDRFDAVYGGFGGAPKFPSPHQLVFLLRYGHRAQRRQATHMAEHTLFNMRRGGIFDHIGFGFHRYATDPEWLLPHFEKMLYDQALIVLACTEAFEATRNDAFLEIVEKTLTYVLRDMHDAAGGFYSAEDADSEGVEGKFYVWSVDEVRRVLDPGVAEMFIETYGLTEVGNFREEATGRRTGENIPHLQDFFHVLSREDPGRMALLEAARARLFEARERRVHPLKDDKILTDWNGLMIAALARAGDVFGKAGWIEAACRAAAFLGSHLADETGRLLHRYRNGKAGLQANLDDYAFLIWGLIECHQATFDTDHLARAIALQADVDARFWDDARGGYFFTPHDGEELIARHKEFFDGATPSGNAAALMNLLRLARLTGRPDYDERADRLLKSMATLVEKQPSAFTAWLAGLDFALGPAQEIVVVGEPDRFETRRLLDVLRSVYLPRKVILLKHAGNAEALTTIAPFTKEMEAPNDVPTVYVCENFQCHQPVTDPEALRAVLSA